MRRGYERALTRRARRPPRPCASQELTRARQARAAAPAAPAIPSPLRELAADQPGAAAPAAGTKRRRTETSAGALVEPAYEPELPPLPPAEGEAEASTTACAPLPSVRTQPQPTYAPRAPWRATPPRVGAARAACARRDRRPRAQQQPLTTPRVTAHAPQAAVMQARLKKAGLTAKAIPRKRAELEVLYRQHCH